MEINGKRVDIDELVDEVYNEKSMIKMRGHGI